MKEVFSRKLLEVGPNMWKVVDRKMAVLLEQRAKDAEIQAELERINLERRRLHAKAKGVKR